MCSFIHPRLSITVSNDSFIKIDWRSWVSGNRHECTDIRRKCHEQSGCHRLLQWFWSFHTEKTDHPVLRARSGCHPRLFFLVLTFDLDRPMRTIVGPLTLATAACLPWKRQVWSWAQIEGPVQLGLQWRLQNLIVSSWCEIAQWCRTNVVCTACVKRG